MAEDARPVEPDLIAVYDQLAAESRQEARVVAAYHSQLLDEGVPEYDALQLALGYQRHLIFGDDPDDEEDE